MDLAPQAESRRLVAGGLPNERRDYLPGNGNSRSILVLHSGSVLNPSSVDLNCQSHGLWIDLNALNDLSIAFFPLQNGRNLRQRGALSTEIYIHILCMR